MLPRFSLLFMPKRFLNVLYGGVHARINVTDMEDLSEVQEKVNVAFENITVGYSKIQFYNKEGIQIKLWKEFNALCHGYFEEEGLELVIRLIPSPEFENEGIVEQQQSPPRWSVAVKSMDDVFQEINSYLSTLDVESVSLISNLIFQSKSGEGDVHLPLFDYTNPSILFWKLGSYDVMPLLQKCSHSELTVILGSSGSGKTRSVFEVLCKIYGIFFTVTDSNMPGTTDFNFMLDRLKDHIAPQYDSNQAYLDRFVKCLLCARLSLFQHCFGLKFISPQEWLLIQLRFNCIILVNFFRQLNEKDLDDTLSKMFTMMGQKNRENDASRTHVPIFIDEAQYTISLYPNCFQSSTNTYEKPLYCGLYSSISKIPGCSFNACGTGFRLKDATGLLLSRTNKPENIKYIISECFEDIDSVQKYAREVVPDLVISDKYASYFVGRVRFLASFVEYQFIRHYTNDEFMDPKDYIDSITKTTDFDYTLSKLFDSARFEGDFYSDACAILKECVLHYIYFGKPLCISSKQAWLFELAFGRLIEHHGNLISVDEPLILATAKNLLLNDSESEHYCKVPISRLKDCFESRLSSCNEASSQGFLWENYISVRIAELLTDADPKSYVKLVGFDVGTCGKLYNAHSQPLCTTSKEVSLSHFLQHKNSAFYFPEKKAGPDLVFFLEIDNVISPVFIQCKLRKEMNCEAGLRTTDPNHFFCYRKKPYAVMESYANERKAIFEQLTSFKHQFGVLIAYPAALDKSVKIEKTIGVVNDPKFRYEYLLDGKNIGQVLEEEHLLLLKFLKCV
jgi:hypothetical protein